MTQYFIKVCGLSYNTFGNNKCSHYVNWCRNVFIVPAKVNKYAVVLCAALNPADFRLDNSPQRLSNSQRSPCTGSQSMVVWCSGAGPGWLSTSPPFPLWRSQSPTSARAGLPAYELMSLSTSMSKNTSSRSGKVNVLYHSTLMLNFSVVF